MQSPAAVFSQRAAKLAFVELHRGKPIEARDLMMVTRTR